MTTIMQSEIFFFISSIGFIVLWILVAIVLVRTMDALNTFSKILKIIERDIDSIGDTTKEIVEDMRDSSVFRFLLGRRRKIKK